jgi:hypothetical protein
MNYELLLVALLFCSLTGNLSLGFLVLFKKPESAKKEITYDVQALLRDLSTGPALLKVEYLDRADVLLRSPRDHV